MSDYNYAKQELLDSVLSGRKKLDETLARVHDDEMSIAVLHGKWSVKDLIGHLGFWEESVATLFTTLRAERTPELFPELDELNAKMLAEWGKFSLSAVKEREKAAFEHVMVLLQSASAEELLDPAHFPWTDGRPFARFFHDNTCGHYEEHLPELIVWLKRIA